MHLGGDNRRFRKRKETCMKRRLVGAQLSTSHRNKSKKTFIWKEQPALRFLKEWPHHHRGSAPDLRSLCSSLKCLALIPTPRSVTPEVDRNEKPGRKKMTPPPAPAALFLTSDMEEDVYLNPNEEQGDDDDLYLEPAAACPPGPRGLIRISSSTKTSLTSSPIMKPPVPRAKSNSFLPSLIEVKTAPTFEARAATFPSKPPPTMPGFKPPLPAMLSPLNPRLTDMKHATFGGARVTEGTENEDPVWFAGNCDRKTAEDLLLRINTDGTFLIRHSSGQTARQPFTLAVLYQQKVYNVPIRFLEEMQGFALGKEGKKSEEVFRSLDEMVMHHKVYQLYLIDSKSQAKHAVFLTHSARP
ncbi:B-cell linker protein isoform X2 [Nerophis ophidion]|uniref:B-cell linker protein isoform X2 n=1 Tax=Nerophis ophidion TaxID=159077 RepID=UPI002ADF4F8D|nr:B-cell linker protein isoform X2 [Nerophis ophidion]